MIYIILNSTTGFVIKYFDWMYTTISYIYVCVVILIIKTDLMNLKKEMIKIKIEEKKNEKKCILYAWCLMPNHVHILLKEKNQSKTTVLYTIHRNSLCRIPYGNCHNGRHNILFF